MAGSEERDALQPLLWSARRAGKHLILSREEPGLDALRAEGLVRDQLGHVVLTYKGEVRRRRCSPYPVLRSA